MLVLPRSFALTEGIGHGSILLIHHNREMWPLEREEPMKYLVRALALAVGVLAFIAGTASSQAQDGPKLYVFTSGSLGGFPKAALQIGGQGNIDWAPVSFYVITHSRGNIIFDTGNNDKTITDAEGWWGPLAKGLGLNMTNDDSIPAQLANIGLKTDAIK